MNGREAKLRIDPRRYRVGVAFEIEPFRPTAEEYRERVDIHNAVQPAEPCNVERERNFDLMDAEAGRSSATLVARLAGRSVGLAHVREPAMYSAPGRRTLWLGVVPDARNRGIGSALHDAAEGSIRAGGGTEVLVNVRDTERRALDFCERRGFHEIEREWEMYLDLTVTDPTPLEGPPGFDVVTLPEYRRADPEWLERLWRLFDTIQAGIPASIEYTGMSLEDFRRLSIDNPDAVPEAFFIGLVGGTPVGLTTLWLNADEADTVHQDLTGVLPEYRRRGYATALKRRGIAWARDTGFRRILTSSSSLNEPMVTLNEALGFRKAAGWSFRRKQLR